jgi:signal transduction histidine kinase
MRIKLPIYSKLLILSSVFIFALLLIVAFVIYSFKVQFESSSYNQLLNNLLQSQKARKEFQAKKDLKYYRNYMTYQDLNDSLLKPFEAKPVIIELNKQFESYRNELKEFGSFIEQRGLNENLGIEGKFRKDIHAIETTLDSNSNNEILVQLLQARRREKDFLLRGSIQYVSNVQFHISKLIELTNKSSMSNITKNDIITKAKNYESSFVNLSILLNKINEYDKSLTNLENELIKTLVNLAELKQSDASLLQDLQITISIIAIIVSILLSILISKRLTAPIIELVRVAQVVTLDSNYNQKVEIKTGDEIGDLANAFNIMIDKISVTMKKLDDTNKNLEKMVDERTNELQSEVYRKMQAEAKLEAAYMELENANYEIKHALEKEKELNELKSRFVAIVSHEYRTPLTVINNSTFLIETFLHHKQYDKIDSYIQRIQTSIKGMILLLDDTLTIGKIESGKVTVYLKQINLLDYLDNLIDELKLIDIKKHKFIVENYSDKLNVICDENILNVIISNILSNAIKFSNEGSDIIVSVKHDDIFFYVSIQDNGIGIPKKDQKFLFDPFYRSENVQTISGTGLGLSIVKKYSELLGGSVSFDSKIGKGTTFYIQLPIAFNNSDDLVVILENKKVNTEN